MKIILYNFTKRVNSTATPSAGGTEFDVQLKDNCSAESPSVTISSNPTGFNYAFISAFSRYYFITNWVFEGAYWRVDMTEDLLGSNKAAIKATSAMILYASDAGAGIIDNRIPLSGSPIIKENYVAINGFDFVTTTGPRSVILGLTGKGTSGPILLDDRNDLPYLIDGVDSVVDGLADVLEATKQLMYGGSAGSCIKSAIGLPLKIDGDAVLGEQVDIVLGNYPCLHNGSPITGHTVVKYVLTSSTTIAIPWENVPLWRKYAPYTSIMCYIPFIGTIQLPNDKLIDESYIDVDFSINVTTGDISILVRGYESRIIVGAGSGNCALPVAFGDYGINTNRATQAIGAGLTAAAGFLSANPAMVFAGLSGAAAATISAMGGSSEGAGGLGGGASMGFDMRIALTTITRNVSDPNPTAIIGKPLMKVDVIGNRLPGYIQTDGFSLVSNCSKSEADEINAMMDRGVYID